MKEWGKDSELGSWKTVLDRHGPNVAYAALRQGTLPYVPHSLLLPGHGVKWPESHEFIMQRKFWRQNWRETIDFETDEEQAATQKEINGWLKKHEPGCNSDDLQDWAGLLTSASTGIPDNVVMEPIAPPTDTVIKSEAERAIHPDFCGPKYDELHNMVVKNISSVVGVWPKKKTKHEIEFAKAEGNPLCAPVIKNAKLHLQLIEVKIVIRINVFSNSIGTIFSASLKKNEK